MRLTELSCSREDSDVACESLPHSSVSETVARFSHFGIWCFISDIVAGLVSALAIWRVGSSTYAMGRMPACVTILVIVSLHQEQPFLQGKLVGTPIVGSVEGSD